MPLTTFVSVTSPGLGHVHIFLGEWESGKENLGAIVLEKQKE